jgi:methionine sulfoxide reductase heme-binding subunit
MNGSLSSALWYLGRGTGVVTLVLLTMVVVLGIAVRSGRPLAGLPRFGVGAVHRTASLLAVTLLVVHVSTLLFDPYAQLRLLDVVLPFGGTYRPLWLGLGTLASDLLLALVVTSLLRQRLGVRVWRAVHWAAYAAWPFAVLHGLGTGTDAGATWLRVLVATCVAAVALSLLWRTSSRFSRRPGPGPGRKPLSRPTTVSTPSKELVP